MIIKFSAGGEFEELDQFDDAKELSSRHGLLVIGRNLIIR
jgi:hypothetical protein